MALMGSRWDEPGQSGRNGDRPGALRVSGEALTRNQCQSSAKE
jgi:hypothetical protein